VPSKNKNQSSAANREETSSFENMLKIMKTVPEDTECIWTGGKHVQHLLQHWCFSLDFLKVITAIAYRPAPFRDAAYGARAAKRAAAASPSSRKKSSLQ
jgi:hypothetical protein